VGSEIAISVIVPVYNLAGSIAQNVEVIRDRVAADADGAVEVIVVSDGSIDRTDEAVLGSGLAGVRLLHYDRNLGKGYAVKVGALEARGRWIAYCDADLDLDPASLPRYVAEAARDGLDFAIGSKRHPNSKVVYPRSRRAASWLFQQFVRVLFQLDVRDTQTGLKVFRREVAEQVVPLLLVKRYAFDIELLAVARAFGFSKIREMPVTLDYQFTGSGVRPAAVLVALTDTLAVFYRLRILRTYQRKRMLFGAFGWTRPTGSELQVELIAAQADAYRRIEHGHVKIAATPDERRVVVQATKADLIAFVEDGGVASGNFISATVPFFVRPEVAAVVVSNVAPTGGSVRARAAAAIRESRLGGGSQYYRFMPGNIRYVRDFRAASYVVRRDAFLALDLEVAADEAPEAISAQGGRVIYTPEAFVVAAAAPLFRPHLRNALAHGRARAAMVARHGVRALRPLTAIAFAAFAFVVLGWLLSLVGPDWVDAWAIAVLCYVTVVALQALASLIQYRSVSVTALVMVGLVLTHAAYVTGLASGLVRAPASRRAARTRSPQARA
jgi:glycosyltransferase involved in cell wall biosynthesis